MATTEDKIDAALAGLSKELERLPPRARKAVYAHLKALADAYAKRHDSKAKPGAAPGDSGDDGALEGLFDPPSPRDKPWKVPKPDLSGK
jgi:hypothetical protein